MAYHLTHPDSDLEIKVEADRVSTYLSQGWQTKPGAKAPESNDDTPIVTVLPSADGFASGITPAAS